MKVKTKYTIVIIGIFILELLPVPFSSIYSLYAIRKRPNWLPNAIDRLYAESPNEDTSSIDVNLVEANFRRVQTQCTLTLAIMFTIDLLVPVVIPTALYVVRKRPIWFKKLITQLYADKLAALELNRSVSSSQAIKQMNDDELQQKLAELDASNLDAAKLLLMKNNRRLSSG